MSSTITTAQFAIALAEGLAAKGITIEVESTEVVQAPAKASTTKAPAKKAPVKRPTKAQQAKAAERAEKSEAFVGWLKESAEARKARKAFNGPAAQWMRENGLVPSGPAWDEVKKGERSLVKLRKLDKAHRVDLEARRVAKAAEKAAAKA